MSRPASKLTWAIRKLVDKNDMTHAEARPQLAKLGFEIAAEQEALSDELSCLLNGDLSSKNLKKLLASKSLDAKMKSFDEDVKKRVLREIALRIAFADEANYFNVTKNIWSKFDEVTKKTMRDSAKSTPSRKPVSSKNTKAQTAKELPTPKHRNTKKAEVVVVKRRGRPAGSLNKRPKVAVVADVVVKRRGRPAGSLNKRPTVSAKPIDDSLGFITKNGGVSAALARVAELREEAEKLEQAVAVVYDLQKRIKEAA
jgi:hypothetical protein